MSVISFFNQPFLVRVMQVLFISLMFLCVGTLTVGMKCGPIWQVTATVEVMAGLTGLIADACEIFLGRMNAGVMFVISLMMPSALVILWIAFLPPFWAEALWTSLGRPAIAFLCFVASMMVCWRMIELARGGTPAVSGRLPP